MEEPIGHEHHEQRHPSPGEPTTTDPVCGMSVPPNSPHSYMHGGSRIVFCCGGCKDRFIENPAAYVLRTESRPDAATDGRVYTCPMHPDVRQAIHGSCPKCGMALEPRSPAVK